MPAKAMNIVHVLYYLFAIIIFETVIILYTFMKTPAVTFIKCMLFKKSLVIEKYRGGPFYALKAAKKDGKTSLEVRGKPKNRYFITAESMMIWDKGKIPTYFVPSNTTFTSNFDFQAIIDVIERKIGKPVKDYAELINAINLIKTREPDYPIKLSPYKTIKLRDLDRYYPSYMNTEDVEAKINLLAKKESLLSKLNPTMVMMIVIILIAGAIAYTIITKNQTPNITVLVQNGTSAIQSATGGAGTGAVSWINGTMGSVLG